MLNIFARFVCGARAWLLVLAIANVMASTADAGDTKKSLYIPQEGVTQVMKLVDGSTVVGRVTEIGDEEIKFETEVGELTVGIAQIVEIKELTQPVDQWKKGWFPNPNRTRLIIAPTGRTLRAGEGYFSDILLFFPSVSVGITDNITIGGGISIFPGVGFDKQLFFFTPKVGFSVNDEFSVAVSTILIRLPTEGMLEDDSEVEIVGVLFGTSTVGTEDGSLTFGLGFGYTRHEFSDNPAVLLGGELRVLRRMSLITENWVFPEVDDPLLSYGLRFFGDELSVDLAFFNTINDDAILPGFPFINFVVNF